jgi:hypothetical protein
VIKRDRVPEKQTETGLLKIPRSAVVILMGAAIVLSLGMGLRQSLGIFMPNITRGIGISVADFTLAIAVQNLSWGACSSHLPAHWRCASVMAASCSRAWPSSSAAWSRWRPRRATWP